MYMIPYPESSYMHMYGTVIEMSITDIKLIAWTSNYIDIELLSTIIHTCPNFSGCSATELQRLYIPHKIMPRNYLSMPQSQNYDEPQSDHGIYSNENINFLNYFSHLPSLPMENLLVSMLSSYSLRWTQSSWRTSLNSSGATYPVPYGSIWTNSLRRSSHM